MSCITRSVLRWGLISGLALGGVTLLVGPERVAMGVSHVRSKVQGVVDHVVDDPVALRRQLQQLAEQYPDRIAEVRGEVAEVDHQLAQFERDVDIAQRVVAAATDDLGQLKTLVARAEQQANNNARTVSISFQGVRFDINEAYNEAHRINNVRSTYRDRLEHDKHQVKFLTEQRARLNDILGKLESEYSTYQSKLWALDRQIDAVQRNDRLIELTEAQQATLNSYSKFEKVGNLRQLEAKLAELRAVQEAQLQALSKHGIHNDYEDRVRAELDMQDIESVDPFADLEEESGGEEANNREIAFADEIVIKAQ